MRYKKVSIKLINNNIKIKNMEDTYMWVFNIVESCNHDFHFGCADVLISLFKIKYGDSDRVSELASLRQTKWNTIHAI